MRFFVRCYRAKFLRVFAPALLCLLFAVAASGCGLDGEGELLTPGPSLENDSGGVIRPGDVTDAKIGKAECECPLGYACFDAGDGEECLPDGLLACAKCVGDHECLGGSCREVDGEGPFCAVPCKLAHDGTDSCPGGFTCTPEGAGDDVVHLCLPDNGSCSCRPEDKGSKRACLASSCDGDQTCEDAGWGLCDAPGATVEDCDGVDNDCDGQTDEGLPASKACELTGPTGPCAGAATCKAALGWVCDAPTASPEVCDGVDNDCDGETDEPWRKQGKYVGHEHCGQCGNSCDGAFANGTAACDADGLPPHCVVVACDEGFVIAENGTCEPIPKPICKDGDCTCTLEKIGKTQQCTRENDLGKCTGSQECFGAAGWGDCSAKIAAAESCDGLDEDCDGQTDEGTAGAKCANTNPFGSCPGTVQCGGLSGPWCQALVPSVETCNGKDDDCDGAVDELWKDEKTKQYLHVNHCGGCDNACAKPVDPNSAAACVLKGGAPTCGLACKPGFFDANEVLADGCECQQKEGYDLPGDGDLNCDGIDGVAADAVFVSKIGNDAAKGTRDDPVLSVTKAIAIAEKAKKPWVFVGAGAYFENLQLVAGVSISGGYGKNFAVRDPQAFPSSVVGLSAVTGDSVAVRCDGIGEETWLLGMTIRGGHAAQAGASSYALLISGCGGLNVGGSTIIAGDGAAGINGAAGSNANGGVNGKAGLPAKDIGKLSCGGDDHTFGGAGGTKTCNGQDVSGGQGGTAACPDYNVNVKPPGCAFNAQYNQVPLAIERGRKGKGGSGGGIGGESGGDGYTDVNNGIASQCKVAKYGCDDCVVAKTSFDGKSGTTGNSGGHGTFGGGCTGTKGGIGKNGVWVGNTGKSGGHAWPGAGGGGGGSAGGVETVGCANEPSKYTDLGGSGGGGGSGGCGGLGGGGGTAGGASFAIFVNATGGIPQIGGLGLPQNVLHGGKGGRGGDGGVGGFGGIGGHGAVGGPGGFTSPLTKCAMPGGAGGDGGPGGHGGGGGGGCGGPSVLIGVAKSVPGVAQAYLSNSKVETKGVGGLAGSGGKSGGSSGKPGNVGPSAGFSEWP